jgi:hypothetical protein
MKRVFLLMVISVLLVTLGFAQALDDSNTDQANVKGCLGGSDGNYTVAEDGTGQIFKITTSSVDLKPHLGHDVKLTVHKASGAMGSGAADNSFAVIELNMISEHCAAAAAAPVGTVIPSSETVIAPAAAAVAPSTPAVDAGAPVATASPSSPPVSMPAADAAAPAVTATASPSSETVSPPAAAATTPAATASPSSQAVSTPAADGAQPTRRSARASRVSAPTTDTAAADAATVSPSSNNVIPADADTTPPSATASTPSETVSPPAAGATAPAVTHKRGSLFLLILVAVLVIFLGTLAPLLSKWRKRKMLERTGTPNLSFTKEASSDRDEPEPRKAA